GLMPDQSPILDDPGIIRRAAPMGKPDLWVHPLAAATRGLQGTDLAEMAINASAGARAVATGRRWIGDAGVMRKVLAYARDCGLTVIAH
ncbi:dihydroorotase, partial [Escherichia coli]|nr:dihydroorotase [Escherichia coli]